MRDYKEAMEAVGLPKDDPTEINILRKLREGLGEREE
jgi:hypothetical protein